MLRSMTGFGRSVKEMGDGRITVEIKAVNHRFCEVSARMPRQWFSLEDAVRTWCREKMKRGKIDVSVFLEVENTSAKKVHINWNLLEQFQQQFEEMKRRTGSAESFPLAAMLQHEEIAYVLEDPVDTDAVKELLKPAVEEALHQLEKMRQIEGSSLKEDLIMRIETVLAAKNEVEKYAPQVKENFRQRIHQRVEEFLSGAEMETSRILTEAAVYAEKIDIQEELIRIESHAAQFMHSLETTGPSGRKLDFILQELNREVNTIGSKANAAGISSKVVEMKDALEKMKEQVQNIE